MAVSGHKTESVFNRYRIVSETDLIEAGQRVVADHEKRHGGQSVDTPPPHTRKSTRQSRKT